MSTLRTAAQQALEALEWHYRQGHSNTLGGFRLKIDEKALRKLRAALAEPVQEPVAYSVGRTLHWHEGKGMNDVQLYATPPQRKPLTEDTIEALFEAELLALPPYPSATEELPVRLARAIERAHRIE